jgi:HEAT repeat protein
VRRDQVFNLLEFVLHNGLAEGRRASCQALANFDGPQADELVLRALDDPDAGVQAAAVRQLRDRQAPDALQRLVALLDSPSHEIREAARSSLAEFNFTRYRTMFDLLDEQAARTTGILVHKIDHTAQQQLIDELSSPSLTSKLRAIEIAIAMEVTTEVESQLIELLTHENVALRKEAVAALAHCHTNGAAEALEFATSDPVASIADAARKSLAECRVHSPAASQPTFAENTR